MNRTLLALVGVLVAQTSAAQVPFQETVRAFIDSVEVFSGSAIYAAACGSSHAADTDKAKCRAFYPRLHTGEGAKWQFVDVKEAVVATNASQVPRLFRLGGTEVGLGDVVDVRGDLNYELAYFNHITSVKVLNAAPRFTCKSPEGDPDLVRLYFLRVHDEWQNGFPINMRADLKGDLLSMVSTFAGQDGPFEGTFVSHGGGIGNLSSYWKVQLLAALNASPRPDVSVSMRLSPPTAYFGDGVPNAQLDVQVKVLNRPEQISKSFSLVCKGWLD